MLAVSSGLVTLAEVANIGARLAYAVVIARVLGPSLYGQLAFAMSWSFIVFPLAGGGSDLAVLRSAGKTAAEKERSLAASLALIWRAGSGVVALSMAAGWILTDNPETRKLIAIFSLALLARAVVAWSESAALLGNRTTSIPVRRAAGALLEIGLVTGAVYSGYGVVAVAALHALSQFVMAITWWWALPKKTPGLLRPPRSEVTAMARTALPFAVASMLNALLYNGPLVLGSALGAGEESLGGVALVLQITALLTVLPGATAQAATPRFAEAAHEPVRRQAIAREAFTLVTLLSSVLVLGAATVGPDLTVSLFGSGFAGAGPLLVLGMINGTLIAWSIVAMRLFVAFSTARLVVVTQMLGCVVMAAVQLALSDRIAAPLWAQTAGALVFVVGFSLSSEVGGLPRFVSHVWRPLLGAAVAVGAGMGLSQLHPWVGLAAGLAALGGLYAVLRPRV